MRAAKTMPIAKVATTPAPPPISIDNPPKDYVRDRHPGGQPMTARELALALDPKATLQDERRWLARCPLCSHAELRVALWDTVPDNYNIFAGCEDLTIVAACGCPTAKLRAHGGAAP
ncbi:hypothetical protein SAMN02990966_06925 [Rhodospirillales bacterium URHD0017]|nr:hypothetical protein SAMN02990966_06925 [Rhodospirillales bacterium URHD0017]